MSRNRNVANKSAPVRNSVNTMTVACRLPCGLKVPVYGHGTLDFKGANSRDALIDESGHGLTSVDANAWAALKKQHARAKWLTSGAVFAHVKVADAKAEAEERGEIDVGFNGADPITPASNVMPAVGQGA